MEPLRLKPSVWKVSLFFVGALAAVIIPIGIGILIGFLGPPPFLLDRGELNASWLDNATSVEGVLVRVTKCDSPEEAEDLSETLQAGLPIESINKTLSVFRYVRRDNGLHGLVLPIEEVVLQLEGQDESQIDRTLASLPFVRPNPSRNPIYVLFTEHLEGFFWGLGIYLVLFGVGLARGGSWAATIEGDRSVTPFSWRALRDRLVDINQLDLPVEVKEKRPGYLTVEWRLADARWTSLFETGGLEIAHSLKLRFDEAEHVVRAIDVARRIRWSAGVPHAAFSFSVFRGITFYQAEAGTSYGFLLKDGRWEVAPAYQYSFNLNELKKPVVEAIVLSGWTYKPVVTFFRLVGG